MARSKYRFKTRAEYENAFKEKERESFTLFVALHETLNEHDHLAHSFIEGDVSRYSEIIREEGGNFLVALIRPLAPDGGTVLIREKTSTHTATHVFGFETWHKEIQDRLRKGLIAMDSDEWPLVTIAEKLWRARRNRFDEVLERAGSDG